ncbi:unnamed protein product [Meganyctiphanes norvegica]|uniref:Secretory carrier-associated membrane protein n=1 Tax=Meganyctiphanes norvegica TaxID=48144 RepID=A0AAV2PXB9_MEGNR
MSGFDDNPFADPFAEPSIQQATRGSSAPQGLEDYDPFSATPVNNTTTPAVNNGPAGQMTQPVASQPAVVNPTTTTAAPPPTYTPSAQQQVTSQEFQRRQEELERKAAELARKEQELNNAGATAARQNNWPPLPAICPVGPCFYQDINVDIPLEFQKVVRMLYYLWMFHVLMLLLNMLGGLSLFIAFPSEGPTFGLSILYAFIFAPASYVCWFRTVYKAFRNDSSFNFMVFFVIFFFQLIVSVIWAIGIPGTGACGWVAMAKAFSGGYIFLGIVLTLLALAGTALAGSTGFMLIWVHRIYRSTGCSFLKAQGEFTTGVMRNDHVQGVMANAASAAVRNQFTGPASTPTGSTTSATSPRF